MGGIEKNTFTVDVVIGDLVRQRVDPIPNQVISDRSQPIHSHPIQISFTAQFGLYIQYISFSSVFVAFYLIFLLSGGIVDQFDDGGVGGECPPVVHVVEHLHDVQSVADRRGGKENGGSLEGRGQQGR